MAVAAAIEITTTILRAPPAKTGGAFLFLQTATFEAAAMVAVRKDRHQKC